MLTVAKNVTANWVTLWQVVVKSIYFATFWDHMIFTSDNTRLARKLREDIATRTWVFIKLQSLLNLVHKSISENMLLVIFVQISSRHNYWITATIDSWNLDWEVIEHNWKYRDRDNAVGKLRWTLLWSLGRYLIFVQLKRTQGRILMDIRNTKPSSGSCNFLWRCQWFLFSIVFPSPLYYSSYLQNCLNTLSFN